MKKCVDISAWQSEVSVKSFKETGVDLFILRSSYTTQSGFSLYKDKVFDNNIKNAHKAGKQIGIYHYSQAITEAEAKQEAQFVLKTIKPYKKYITLPVFFDWEFGGRLNSLVAKRKGKTGCGSICDAFCNEIKKAGYETGVYANLSTLNNYLPANLYKKWSIWLAQYSSTNDYKHPVIMWQYSSSGRVKGLPGKIDVNRWYGKAPDPKPHTPTTYKGTFPTLPKRGYFKKGDKGTQVKNLQKLLEWLGYSVGSAGADGEYGKDTASAVLAFEKDYKLKYKDSEWGSECQAKAKVVQR